MKTRTCIYREGVECSVHKCEHCGWNPEVEIIRKQAIETQNGSMSIEQYARKLSKENNFLQETNRHLIREIEFLNQELVKTRSAGKVMAGRVAKLNRDLEIMRRERFA